MNPLPSNWFVIFFLVRSFEDEGRKLCVLINKYVWFMCCKCERATCSVFFSLSPFEAWSRSKTKQRIELGKEIELFSLCKHLDIILRLLQTVLSEVFFLAFFLKEVSGSTDLFLLSIDILFNNVVFLTWKRLGYLMTRFYFVQRSKWNLLLKLV